MKSRKTALLKLSISEDIPMLYSNHILYVYLLIVGSAKSLIEAAAANRAVVTTDVPGCRDAIIPDETGLLVPVKDSEALANAIQDLIENSKKRENMGKAGRKLAERDFSIENIVVKIYDDLNEFG